MTDHETLKAIHAADQRSQSEKECDAAIIKCSAHTAAHYTFLTSRGLPAPLVARLTETFQASYLASIFGYGIVLPTEGGDE